jgi:hypothetical protein
MVRPLLQQKFRASVLRQFTVTIVDDETDQMKGLSVKDSRPWAKKVTQDFMNRNRPHT